MPLDYDSFDYNAKNYVKIYGKDSSQNSVCLIHTCPIYMWATLSENATEDQINNLIEKIKKIYIQTKERTTRIEKIEIHNKNFLEKPTKALKIFATNYKDLQAIASEIDSDIIQKRRGYDIGFITHYIIESEINPMSWYKIETEEIDQEDFDFIKETIETKKILKIKSATPIKNPPQINLKPLAYDIETDSLKPESGEILMISLVGPNYQKVLTWKKEGQSRDFVEFVNDEKELLEAFTKEVKKYSPDFLIGYNSDSFDLPFIKKRAQITGAKIPLSLDKTSPRVKKGVPTTTKLNGIIHIDLIRFIKTMYAQYMQSETLSLNEVSKEFLGDKKIEFNLQHSSSLDKSDWTKYYDYNLQDSKLTLALFQKFYPDMLELTKIVKEPLFKISRNGLSQQIEKYIIHNLKKFNEIPEKRPTYSDIQSRKQIQSVAGAFVYEPTPGLYQDLVMFDFTSMHTSIIITHNISKSTLTDNPENSFKSPEIDSPNGKKHYYFTKKQGVFPTLLKELFEKRKFYKSQYKKNPNPITKAQSNAFKVLSASAHGYIGFYGSRYYSWEASSSILAFVRKYNMETIEKIKQNGHNVIYGDTDSVAFTRNGKTDDQIISMLNQINSSLPGVMHLELEGFFKRGLWVTTRAGNVGAKKKYAMIDNQGKIKIRGFETVRRDWCKLARKTQDKILRDILQSGNETKALEYVKEIAEKLKKRQIDKNELIIKTKLKKPLSEYKSISPHVTAAKKMKDANIPLSEGTLIEYYIGQAQGKLVRDKALLPSEDGKYDINYYLEKQLIPATETIFNVFNIKIKEEIDGKKQENLNKWF